MNILLITGLYPANDVQFLNNTAVCHYFAKEWLKLGYNVKVIYAYRIYPWYYYPLMKLFNKYLANWSNSAILDKRLDYIYDYQVDGVNVTRIPISITRPHGYFTDESVSNCTKSIATILNRENFTPDYILGHFIHPSLELVVNVGNLYPWAKTALSVHGLAKFNERDRILLNKINYIGYRSYPIMRSYENIYGIRPFFVCPSGVPAEYIVKGPKSFSNGVSKFIFVGNFMQRKFPSVIVRAVKKTYNEDDFLITFVGEGKGKDLIEKKAKQCSCLDKIVFTGKITREEVTQEIDNADVFIMISENETFGLVYLEAMSRGCITIASRNEGMDGFIEDGINGFLCKSGDENELSELIKKIKNMTPIELIRISQAAINTALKMTDYNVAKNYIESIV